MNIISFLLTLTWCAAFPVSFAAIGMLDLSFEDSLAVLGAMSSIGLIAGLLQERRF